jgi:hypothetical protein
VRFSNNITRMWVGFVIPTLYFVLVKIDQCFGEPEPLIGEALGAVASIVGIASSISSLLSSASQRNEGGIYIRQEKGGCLDAGLKSYNCWNPTIGEYAKDERFAETITFR